MHSMDNEQMPFPNLFSLKPTHIHILTHRTTILYTVQGPGAYAEIMVVVAHYRLHYQGLNLDLDFTQN